MATDPRIAERVQEQVAKFALISFDESKHSRSQTGQFASGGGGPAKKPKPKPGQLASRGGKTPQQSIAALRNVISRLGGKKPGGKKDDAAARRTHRRAHDARIASQASSIAGASPEQTEAFLRRIEGLNPKQLKQEQKNMERMLPEFEKKWPNVARVMTAYVEMIKTRRERLEGKKPKGPESKGGPDGGKPVPPKPPPGQTASRGLQAVGGDIKRGPRRRHKK